MSPKPSEAVHTAQDGISEGGYPWRLVSYTNIRRGSASASVQVFQKLQQGSEPGNPLVRQRWARLFLRPSVNRVPDACELLLTAAVGMLKAGAPAAHIRGELPEQALGVRVQCLQTLTVNHKHAQA